MFPLSHMLTSFVKTGKLTVIDHQGTTHVFGGRAPGPDVTMKITDPALYKGLFFNPELNMGEAYTDGRVTFPDRNGAPHSFEPGQRGWLAARVSCPVTASAKLFAADNCRAKAG